MHLWLERMCGEGPVLPVLGDEGLLLRPCAPVGSLDGSLGVRFPEDLGVEIREVGLHEYAPALKGDEGSEGGGGGGEAGEGGGSGEVRSDDAEDVEWEGWECGRGWRRWRWWWGGRTYQYRHFLVCCGEGEPSSLLLLSMHPEQEYSCKHPTLSHLFVIPLDIKPPIP